MTARFRAGAAICFAYMNKKVEDYDKIRQGFQICGGYHTLQAELDRNIHMDKESLWSSQTLGLITLCKCLLVPGSTKQMVNLNLFLFLFSIFVSCAALRMSSVLVICYTHCIS